MLKAVTSVAVFTLFVHFIAVAKPMALSGDSLQAALYKTLAQSIQGNIDRMFYEVSMKPKEATTVVPSVTMFNGDPLSWSTMISKTSTDDIFNDIVKPALAEKFPSGGISGRPTPRNPMRSFHHFPFPRD